ncbi:hypothetical protein Barb4_01797 [Bacteroidales bacterium Barb4]|nr:hypothetical protein Barb4_01797 [Bacteroidales bacterium Barb4]
MDNNFRLLVNRNFTSNLSCILLRICYNSNFFISFTSYSPIVAVRHDMLIFSHIEIILF